MSRIFLATKITLVLLIMGVLSVQAEQEPLNINKFRKLYDSLLAGKTLLTETKENGVVVKKERRYGKAIDVGDGDFEIPVRMVITSTKDGKLDQKITVDILDRVHDLGGNAIVYEEIRKVSVEELDSKSRDTSHGEFSGLYSVAKNEKGGFVVHNFGLIPSVVYEDNSLSLAGSMISYSCFQEDGKTKCVLTIRDYKLGDYRPLLGYKLIEPVGGDVVEIGEEVGIKK